MTKDDLLKIAELAEENELGDLLGGLVEEQYLQAASQAAYNQGKADAFRALHNILIGKISENQGEENV